MQNRRFFPENVEKNALWKEEKKDLEHVNRRFFPDDVEKNAMEKKKRGLNLPVYATV